MYTHALLRLPNHDFAAGLTQSREGVPDYESALEQHQRYCVALSECGLSLTILPADPRHPDGCFVEDTALLTPLGAILMRPGAPSRQGEVHAIAAALRGLFREIPQIFDPGTVDAGDVCDADGYFLIGLSTRTNEEGARQLAGFLGDLGYPSSLVDIRAIDGLLHLKSGIAWLGDGRMVVTPEIPRTPALAPYELIELPAAERYAANCLRVNDRVLVADGYPRTRAAIEACGYETIALEMSEFRKMDGGLSCLSLRF
ncbi:MAG: dimethylarginine dimethylaminohydrolase family protein [Steroidobacteraceae bacterium]